MVATELRKPDRLPQKVLELNICSVYGSGMRAPRMCCLDLDTFFVSVERLLDPSLRGRPVVVGGRRGGRGVVTSASYEVRAFGVRSGMSIREASERAPVDAVFVSGHGEAHTAYSKRARDIVERFSPVVVAASIDEHYLDFRGCERLYRRHVDADDDATILRVVREMTAAIDRELGLPASAGIATSKPMAKVASALAKPHGVLLVRAGTEAATLAPLGVRRLPGVGPVAEARLHAAGIETIAQLAAAAEETVRPIFGAYTTAIRLAARGEGADELGRERPAFREHDPFGVVAGTISNERTFVETSRAKSDAVLSGLCERVCSRARRRGVVAGQVTLKLRYTDFQTISRGRTIAPTSVDVELHRIVHDLYREARDRPLAIRLLGVAVAKLRLDAAQLALFDAGERRGVAVDRVRDRFGYDAVHLATTIAGERGRGTGGGTGSRRHG
jgi:DNA polymerase-4